MPTPLQDALREFLKDRDSECPGCGYNVRDLPGDRCPECNQQLELALKLSEPKQGALIAGLVGLSAGAGLGGLLLIYWAIMVFVMKRRPTGSAFDDFFFINLIGFLAHALCLGLWIKNWRKIRLLSSSTRSMLVILCWALPLIFIVVFAAKIK